MRYAALMFLCLFGAASAMAQTEVADTTQVTDIDEVVVTAFPIVKTADGYNVRVAGNKLLTGKSSMQFLSWLPNISQQNGVILINGIQANRITIDGRKVTDLSELRSIPAEMMESVEVKYTADADILTDNPGGTIEIHLKKASPNGFYGSVQGGWGTAYKRGAANENVGGAFCAKVGNLNIFESPSMSWLDLVEKASQSIETDGMNEYADIMERTKSHTFRNNLGLNYELSPAHSIGINWNVGFSGGNFDSRQHGTSDINLFSTSKTFNNLLALNYAGRILPNGDRISVSAEWMRYKYTINQTFSTPGYDNPDCDYSSDFLKGSIDYQHSFGRHVFNAGGVYNGAWMYDTQSYAVAPQTPVTRDDVDATAGMVYASMQGQLGELKYYGGLNWQINRVKATDAHTNTQNAVNPTVQLSLPFGSRRNNQVSLLYKHILDDIPYYALSERQVWSDAYTYSIGNRYLKAPTEHYVNLLLSLLDQTVNLSASYSRDINTIYWQTFDDPQRPGVTFSRPVNIAPLDIWALRAELTRTFFGCWTVKGIARIGFNPENCSLGGVDYKGTRLRQYYSLSTSLNLQHGWGGSINAYIEPTYRYLDRTYHTVWQMDCSVYKTFLNNRLQLIAEFTPLGRRRRLDRYSAATSVSKTILTPVQRGSLQVVWYFSGGKRDVNVNMQQSTLQLREIKDDF